MRGRWNGRPSAYTFVDKHLSGFLGDKIALESELLMSQVVGAVVFALRGEFHVEKDVLRSSA